jgi:hypothetical protein
MDVLNEGALARGQAEPQNHIPESADMMRLYVEYVDLPSEVGKKIEELIRDQKGVLPGNDIEAMFSASDKIAGANCHKTSLYLTGHLSRDQLFSPDNTDPKTAGHAYVQERSNLYPAFTGFAIALKKRPFPFRVSFFKQNFPQHSITVLGVSSKGNLIGFEKEDAYADTPFRYINVTKSIGGHLGLGYVPGLEK